MATVEIEGIPYETLVVSDMKRDSLQFECYRCQGTDRKLLLEVVRFDSERKFVVMQYVEELPLALLEYVTKVARVTLGPFFEG